MKVKYDARKANTQVTLVANAKFHLSALFFGGLRC
jgi:hypothetical protein